MVAACSADDPNPSGTLQSPADDAAESSPATDGPEPTSEPNAARSVEIDSDAALITELTALCVDSSDMACDMLYHASDHNSDAEAIALGCGGRGESVDLFCTEGIVADSPNAWFSGDTPAVSTVVGMCLDGDMIACDFLFVRSAVGSRFEQVGLTCGNRVPVSNPNCRSTIAPGS